MRMSRRAALYAAGGGLPAYYGTIPGLGPSTIAYGAAPVGDYAVFSGGSTSSGTRVKCAYSSSLTRTDALTGYYKTDVSSACSGSYALFAGGHAADSESRDSYGYAYDENLAYTRFSSGISASSGTGATANVNYPACFNGSGVFYYYRGSSPSYHGVRLIDDSLTSTSVDLSTGDWYAAAAAASDSHLVVAGGCYNGTSSSGTNAAKAVDSSLVVSAVDSLSAARGNMAAASLDGKLLFFGGAGYWSYLYTANVSSAVDCYDENLVHTVLSPLSAARSGLACAPLGRTVLVAGGHDASAASAASAAAELYTADLVRADLSALSSARYGLRACVTGKYAIFGGNQYCDVYKA